MSIVSLRQTLKHGILCTMLVLVQLTGAEYNEPQPKHHNLGVQQPVARSWLYTF